MKRDGLSLVDHVGFGVGFFFPFPFNQHGDAKFPNLVAGALNAAI
jgi:hypothetical protein